MRQGNNRRGRQPKQQKQGTIPTRNQVFDSDGPEVRVRGNAHQVYDKYTALAREATAAGNHVQAEAYYQFAEHYFRLHLASTVMGGGNNNRRGGPQKDQFPPEALEDPLIFRPDMPEPQERNEQQSREEGEGEGGGNNERKERRDRSRDRNERGAERSGDRGSDRGGDRGGDREERRPRRERKPRNQNNAGSDSNNAGGAQVDPSEQDQPEIPLFHAGMEAPEGEAIVESRAPKPVPAPTPMDEGDGSDT